MRLSMILALGIWLAGCAGADRPRPDNLDRLFSGDLPIIDLTHSLNGTSPYWPNPDGNPFKLKVLATHEKDGAALNAYSTPEHHGTHLDAPIHAAAGGRTVDRIPVRDFFGPAAVIDVSARCEADPDYRLTKQDILDWEKRYGRLPDGVIVLMYTGWSKKWEDYAAYKNQDAAGKMHFPGFSSASAKFLVQERNIKGIGIDDMSVDVAVAEHFDVHRIVNGAGKYHLENVANMHLLPAVGAYLIVAPIKIEGGSGGQVRIFAVLKNSNGVPESAP